MKSLSPHRPSNLSRYAQICLQALVDAGLSRRLSLGGAVGLFHYLDYRTTHDVDAWWYETTTEQQKRDVVKVLTAALSEFGRVGVRSWGDVTSVELFQDDKTVFSFQIATRTVRLQDTISAGWIDIPLDSLPDLAAAKMVALVERGAPRDFLDIYSLCDAGLLNVEECWSFWQQRQAMSGSDADLSRARLAIETHLQRIALHRPLEKIADAEQREQARRVREWFYNIFLQGKNE